ncbi:MAG: DUF1249 domain-containing protein [bacterium]
MQITERQPLICTPRPQSYAGLMEMYEANYMRIRLLCGDVRRLSGTHYSTLDQHIPVSLRIIEQARHTTILCLNYEFDQQNVKKLTHSHKDERKQDSETAQHLYHEQMMKRRPELVVKIYHDARQAEVARHNCRLSQQPRSWEKEVDSVLLCRWRMNRFLYKWSAFLRHQGHSFLDC